MKGFQFTKKIIYFVWGIVKKFAYVINFFDEKPKLGVMRFDETSNSVNNGIIIDKYAIVLHTFDGYKFLWKGFIYFFEKYWLNTNLNHKYFLSEHENTAFPGWKSLLTGGGEWNQRLLNGLKEIDQDYIIYLQEDFWFSKDVDISTINELVGFCNTYDIKLLKLHDKGSDYILETTEYGILGKPISRVNKNSEYLISHAVSIWKKDFLVETINQSVCESPRENEIKGTLRIKFARDQKFNIYQYNMFSRDLLNDDICFSSYREVCRRGEYNQNIKEFIEILV